MTAMFLNKFGEINLTIGAGGIKSSAMLANSLQTIDKPTLDSL